MILNRGDRGGHWIDPVGSRKSVSQAYYCSKSTSEGAGRRRKRACIFSIWGDIGVTQKGPFSITYSGNGENGGGRGTNQNGPFFITYSRNGDGGGLPRGGGGLPRGGSRRATRRRRPATRRRRPATRRRRPATCRAAAGKLSMVRNVLPEGENFIRVSGHTERIECVR